MCSGGSMPVLGIGTWEMGERATRRAGEVAALRLALELGMVMIDTAEMYGEGGAEEVVGEAIAGSRNKAFLVSKVYPHNATRRGVVAACKRSLKRLGTDYLDLYLLHWRGSVPLAQTVAGFEELKSGGQIRAWGVSNFDTSDMEELLAAPGGSHCAANQILYHLQERAIEHAVIPWCEKNGVAVVAYSPFGHGRFPGPNTKGGRVLRDAAAAHGATPRQVALRFLLRRPSLFAIPKASNPEHAADNAGAGDLRLTDEELARIDAAFPRGPRPRELPML